MAALCGSLSAALCAMVSSLTYRQKGMESQRDDMSSAALGAQALKHELSTLVEEDARAFDAVVAARRIKAKTEDEKAAKREAVEKATEGAALVPMRVLEKSVEVVELCATLASMGYEACVSDAGTAASVALAAAQGAYLNVVINASVLEDRGRRDQLLVEARHLLENVRQKAAGAFEVAAKRAMGEDPGSG